MKKMLRFARSLFLNDMREFEAMFWSIIFPLILYFILTAVFGGMGTSDLSFKMGLVKDEELKGMGTILEQVIDGISGEDGPFVKEEYDSLENALEDLRTQKLHILIHIPEGTTAKLTSALMFANLKIGEAELDVHYISGKQDSETAASIMEQIIGQVNLEIASRQNPDFKSFEIANDVLTVSEQNEFNYSLYLFPGILLMMILSVSLFNGPIGLVINKESGINKKLYSTPLNPYQYFFANFIKIILTMLTSMVLIYLMAIFVYSVDFRMIINGPFIVSVLLSMIVMLGFGMMISSLVKKLSTMIALAQISLQVLMFLGGLYFPVFDVPIPLKWIVYGIPTTYLVELMRRNLGLNVAPVSQATLYIVPMIWFVASVFIFAVNFKKVMGYE